MDFEMMYDGLCRLDFKNTFHAREEQLINSVSSLTSIGTVFVRQSLFKDTINQSGSHHIIPHLTKFTT